MNAFKRIDGKRNAADQIHAAIAEKQAELRQALAVLGALDDARTEFPEWLQWILLQVIYEIEDWRGSTLIVPPTPHQQTVELAGP